MWADVFYLYYWGIIANFADASRMSRQASQ